MDLKKIVSLVVAALILSFSYQSKANFNVTINISNCKEGLKAYLAAGVSNREMINVIDSAALNAGEFKLKGNVDKPQFMMVYLLSDHHNKINYATPVIGLFIDNSDIKIIVDFADVPGYRSVTANSYPYHKVKVTGSDLQRRLMEFYGELDASKKQYSSLIKNYEIAYSKSLKDASPSHVSKGLNMIRPLDSIKMSIRKLTLAAIKSNEANPLGILLTEKNIDKFTKREIDSIYRRLNRHYLGTSELTELSKKIELYNKSSIGAPLLDYVLQDTSGKMVNLWDYVLKKGKFVLLEFYVPNDTRYKLDLIHLKRVYNLYRSSGFEVVTISLNNNKAKWQQAIKDEGSTWLHLESTKAIDTDLMDLYNFNAIPFGIMISPDGTILNRDVSWAWLDKDLISIFGNKFGKSN